MLEFFVEPGVTEKKSFEEPRGFEHHRDWMGLGSGEWSRWVAQLGALWCARESSSQPSVQRWAPACQYTASGDYTASTEEDVFSIFVLYLLFFHMRVLVTHINRLRISLTGHQPQNYYLYEEEKKDFPLVLFFWHSWTIFYVEKWSNVVLFFTVFLLKI